MRDDIRIFLIDPSRLFRSSMAELLRKETGLEVAGSYYCSRMALERMEKDIPDIIFLNADVHDLDGDAFLKSVNELLRRKNGNAGIILCTSETSRHKDVVMKMLESGATDLIVKPNLGPEESARAIVSHLASQCRYFSVQGRFSPLKNYLTPTYRQHRREFIVKHLRTVKAVLIGVSTGGPKLLSKILPQLSMCVDIPILIAQHMPEGFIRTMAANLKGICRDRVVRPTEGELIRPKRIYLAPGGKNMLVRLNEKSEPSIAIRETGKQPAPFVPSVDLLFESAVEVYGSELLGVVLTGMGSDGVVGAAALKKAGARVIVQDEASSVVWGMPGSIASAGLADEILPADDIAEAIAMAVNS